MIRTGHTAGAVDPAGTGLEAAADGKMWVDCRFRLPLESAGLAGFQAVMTTSGGHCLRALEDRENWRLQLHGGCRWSRGVYLKKHHVRTWHSRLRAKLGIGPGQTAGRVEARNVCRLATDGIDVMRLVAYGEQLHSDGLLESFVLTEELDGHNQLDHFLAKRFSAGQLDRTAVRDRDLDRLIRRVAQVARKFHAAGYNHRDLYCCHFFVKEPAPGCFQIKLIDLQRVQHRRRLRRRWLVKDLAQLAYSAPRDRIRCTHKLAFVRHYLGVRKLRPCDKRLVREVLAKQQSMERKLGIKA